MSSAANLHSALRIRKIRSPLTWLARDGRCSSGERGPSHGLAVEISKKGVDPLP